MKMLTVSLLIGAMIALATADVLSAPSCPEDWSAYNGRCFLYVPRAMSWASAERNCQSMRAHLASVHSAVEEQFIQGIITAKTQTNSEAWLGASDCQQDGVWLWSDGRSFSFDYWCTGEPNNQGGNQCCLQMNHRANKCWDDCQCSHTLPSVCATSL